MKAEPGDELIVESAQAGLPVRVGTIIALGSANGTPGYLVHWVAGDYDSLVLPWPGVQIRHHGNRTDAGQQAELRCESQPDVRAPPRAASGQRHEHVARAARASGSGWVLGEDLF